MMSLRRERSVHSERLGPVEIGVGGEETSTGIVAESSMPLLQSRPTRHSHTSVGLTQSAPHIASFAVRPADGANDVGIPRHALSKRGSRVRAVSRDPSATSETKIDVNEDGGTFTVPSTIHPTSSKHVLNVMRSEMLVTGLLYVLNIVSAISIVLVNKYIYIRFHFRYGVILTFYHFALTALGLEIMSRYRMFTVRRVAIRQIWPLSVSFCAYVVLTNLSLQYNSGTFYQILVVPTIGLLQYLLYGIKSEGALIPPMVVMLVGVAIATLTESHMTLLGLAVAFGGIFMTAIYQIMVGTKQKQLGLNAIQLLHHQAPVSSAILLVAAPFVHNLREVVLFPYTPGLVGAIVVSAVCAFFLNMSMYLVLGRSTALTYNVIGLSKLFLVLALNYAVFGSANLSLLNVLGVLIAFSGMCLYSHAKFRLLSQDSKSRQ